MQGLVRGALAVLLLLGTPLSARVMRAEITGTFGYGDDNLGFFGAPLTDLTGMPFMARFSYDTALGNRNTLAGVHDWVSGGTVLGVPNPVDAVYISANGQTRGLRADGYGSAGVSVSSMPEFGDGEYFMDIEEDQTTNYGLKVNLLVMFDVFGPLKRVNAETSFPLQPVYGFGFLQYSVQDVATGQYYVLLNSYLEPAAMSINGSVPEPAMWAMMLAGFAATGSVLRRRRATCPCAPSSAFS